MPRRKKQEVVIEYFTTFQVAEMLHVSPPTVVNWVNSGLLTAHRTPGGHRRIAKADIVGFAKENAYPLPAALALSTPVQLTLPARPPPTRHRILIVDDERDLCMVWREYLLLNDDYEVEVAHSAFAAGRLVERGFKPDLVLLDIQLDPGNEGAMDGFGLLNSLQKDPEFRGIPVIACSAYIDPRIQIHERAGALVGHLQKPFPLSGLAAAVEDGLAARMRSRPVTAREAAIPM